MKQLIIDRLKSLIRTCLKPSFLSWVYITYETVKHYKSESGLPLFNDNYFLFTAAIIGINKYFNAKKPEVK